MRVALLAVAALLASAAPAGAAALVYSGGAYVNVHAAQGDRDVVHLSRAVDGRLEVYNAAGVDPSDSCEAVDQHTARCPMPDESIWVELSGFDGKTRDTADNVLRVGEGVTADVRAQGGDGADALYGGPGDDHLAGAKGDDRVLGGDGKDELRGDEGSDVVAGESVPWVTPPLEPGEPGDDLVYGGPGDDVLDGGPGQDFLHGQSGRDRVSYADHDAGVRVVMGEGDHARGMGAPYTDWLIEMEILVGSPFADTIQGSRSDDDIQGGGGADRIAGEAGADLIDGGEGDDLLLGDSPNPETPDTQPYGGPGFADDLRGGPGADSIRGDGGRDELAGGDGDDIMDAREPQPTQDGRDELVACGAGADRGLLDWNDAGTECEDVAVRPRPETPRPPPPVFGPAPLAGPGPQPALGRPTARAGVVTAGVHCGRATACVARLQLHEVRLVRSSRRGRLRAVRGRRIAAAATRVPAGVTAPARLALPSALLARLRRGAVVRATLELRVGGERWSRPLRLTRAATTDIR